MFEAIARFDIRFRWLIVVVWIVGVVACVKPSAPTGPAGEHAAGGSHGHA